jgi:DNA-binding MarR family transcriptional regulator
MSTVSKEANIEQHVYQALTRAFILLDDSDRQLFASHGLSTRQYWALQHLDEHQGRSMVDLSRVLFTDKSNVTSIIDRLEHLDLVRRTMDPKDRRVLLVTLTRQGRHLQETLHTLHHQRICELFSVLDPTQLQALYAALQSISQNAEGYLERTNNLSS